MLQPMSYLHSLALKAARNLLAKTFFTTQKYPSKVVSFFEGDNLPSCLALLFWFLGAICWTTVYAAIPVTLWVQFYQGHWEGWSSLGQAYDVGAPSRFLIPPKVCGFSSFFPAWFQSSALGRRQQTHCFVTDGPPESESFVALLYCRLSGIRERDTVSYNSVSPFILSDLP